MGPEQSTRSTPSARTRGRVVGQLGLRRVWCSLSWTTWCVGTFEARSFQVPRRWRAWKRSGSADRADSLDALKQVYSKNQSADPNVAPLPKGERPVLPMETVLSLVIDAFTGATERHIEVGDGLQIWTIVKGEGAKLRELREWFGSGLLRGSRERN